MITLIEKLGINGFAELAYAFHISGFEAVDLTMTDLISGADSLRNFSGLACPGMQFFYFH